MENREGRRRSAFVCAAAALVFDIIVWFLPLHGGFGEFGDAFPAGIGVRLTIGLLISALIPTATISTGLVLAWRRRSPIASGVFLATGIFFVLRGVTAPFYDLPRVRPLLLMVLEIGIGLLLLLAAWLSVRPLSVADPPPPLAEGQPLDRPDQIA